MVLVTDVLAFLAAVHDADEHVARTASLRAAEWCAEEGRQETWDSPHGDPAIVAGGKPILVEDVEYSRGGGVEHIARHDPQSVLARVDAERALVALHQTSQSEFVAKWSNSPPHCRTCTQPGDIYESEAYVARLWPCPTLRALAWGYRGREGFDPAWAPDGVEVGA